MSKNKKEKKQRAELDMETTIADMNVEGFRWYNPDKKKGKQNGKNPRQGFGWRCRPSKNMEHNGIHSPVHKGG